MSSSLSTSSVAADSQAVGDEETEDMDDSSLEQELESLNPTDFNRNESDAEQRTVSEDDTDDNSVERELEQIGKLLRKKTGSYIIIIE